VLVTGSTSGIGRHVALMCAREGARVAVHGRNAERGAAVVAEIAAAGGHAIFIPADIAEEAAGAALVDAAAARLDGLTVLANAAAVGYVVNDRRDAGMTAERRTELEAMHLTRLGHPDDVAYAVVWLASRESEFVTGALIPVDGGGTIARGRVLG